MADDEFEPDDVGEDFDEVEDDADIDEIDQQEEDGENIELINTQDARGGVQKSNRITTKYMTKLKNGVDFNLNKTGLPLPLKENLCDGRPSVITRLHPVEFDSTQCLKYLPKPRIPLLSSLPNPDWIICRNERRKQSLLITNPNTFRSQIGLCKINDSVKESPSCIRRSRESDPDVKKSRKTHCGERYLLEFDPNSKQSDRITVIEPLFSNVDVIGIKHKALMRQKSLETSQLQLEPVIATYTTNDITRYVDNIFNERQVEKDALLAKIQKVDATIIKTSEQLAKLKGEAKVLEGAAKNKSNNEDGDQQPTFKSLAEKIYFENKKKAAAAEERLRPFDPNGKPSLYKEPSDTEVVHENRKKFLWFKGKLVKHLGIQKKEKESKLISYNKLSSRIMKKWQEDLSEMESCEERKASLARCRKIFVKEFPELIKKKEEEKMSVQVEIPLLLRDVGPRKYDFFNNNGRIYDFPTEYKNSQRINIWTKEEKEIFKNKYVEHHKDFSKIASFFKKKTVFDCIKYYYVNKKKENFKLLQRKSRTRGKSLKDSSTFINDIVMGNSSGVTTRKQYEQMQKDKQLTECKGNAHH